MNFEVDPIRVGSIDLNQRGNKRGFEDSIVPVIVFGFENIRIFF